MEGRRLPDPLEVRWALGSRDQAEPFPGDLSWSRPSGSGIGRGGPSCGSSVRFSNAVNPSEIERILAKNMSIIHTVRVEVTERVCKLRHPEQRAVPLPRGLSAAPRSTWRRPPCRWRHLGLALPAQAARKGRDRENPATVPKRTREGCVAELHPSKECLHQARRRLGAATTHHPNRPRLSDGGRPHRVPPSRHGSAGWATAPRPPGSPGPPDAPTVPSRGVLPGQLLVGAGYGPGRVGCGWWELWGRRRARNTSTARRSCHIVTVALLPSNLFSWRLSRRVFWTCLVPVRFLGSASWSRLVRSSCNRLPASRGPRGDFVAPKSPMTVSSRQSQFDSSV